MRERRVGGRGGASEASETSEASRGIPIPPPSSLYPPIPSNRLDWINSKAGICLTEWRRRGWRRRKKRRRKRMAFVEA